VKSPVPKGGKREINLNHCGRKKGINMRTVLEVTKCTLV
jgi:hypothetical protein